MRISYTYDHEFRSPEFPRHMRSRVPMTIGHGTHAERRRVKAVKPPTPIEERTPAKNRALVIETLKRNPDGVPKKMLTDMMKGRQQKKFEVLAELALSNITVEYGRPLHVRLK